MVCQFCVINKIERILVLWIFYFGIQWFCTYFPVYLTSQPPFACLHPAAPPTSLPVPFAHYLSPSGFDWIFSRGRNVSTKWIRRNIAFRQARSNFSFNKREHLSSLPSSQAFRTCWALLSLPLASPFSVPRDFRLCLFFQKRFPRKHSIFSYVLYPRDELILKSYGARSIFTNGKLFKLINFDILLAEYIFTI